MALRGSGVRIPSAPVFARSVAENEDCRAVALAKADFFQLATIAQRATTWQASQAEPLAAQSEGCHAGVKHRRPALNALRVGRSKTTAWQAKSMECFFYVYVLVSEVDASIHYTGVTRDLSGRLQEHNRGGCSHTAKHKPWKIETAIAFTSETKARAFEKYLKSGSGREFARRHF